MYGWWLIIILLQYSVQHVQCYYVYCHVSTSNISSQNTSAVVFNCQLSRGMCSITEERSQRPDTIRLLKGDWHQNLAHHTYQQLRPFSLAWIWLWDVWCMAIHIHALRIYIQCIHGSSERNLWTSEMKLISLAVNKQINLVNVNTFHIFFFLETRRIFYKSFYTKKSTFS